jgi:hypothetical protein
VLAHPTSTATLRTLVTVTGPFVPWSWVLNRDPLSYGTDRCLHPPGSRTPRTGADSEMVTERFHGMEEAARTMAFGLLVAAGWLVTGSCQTYLLIYLTYFEKWDIVVLASLATCKISVGLGRRQYKAPQIRSLHGFFLLGVGFTRHLRPANSPSSSPRIQHPTRLRGR